MSALLEDVQAFGEGGHHPVLDAVVDHLHEVAGAVRAAVQVAVLGLRGPPVRPGVRAAASTPGASVAKIGSRWCDGASAPPIIRQKPRSSPQTPPLVPTST